MTGWTTRARELNALAVPDRALLDTLAPMKVPGGAVLFRPGETAKGFVIVLDGRVEVFLTGPTGRDILLYGVEPGQSCVQSTLGLMGGDEYSGEAQCARDSEIVVIPRPVFETLMDRSAPFRAFVFAAFAERLQSMMHLLERVAFQRIEGRLAAALLDLARDGAVMATHQDLAVRIGSAREVVSRRLDAFQRQGLVTTDRGLVRLDDMTALRRLAAAGV